MTRRRVCCLLGMVVMGSLGAVSPPAEAGTFPWYGQYGRTCWQTGQVAAPAEACQAVGNRFLHQTDASGNKRNITEITVAKLGSIGPSGNYCGHAKLSAPPRTPDGSTISGVTGFLPPSPLADFQAGDGSGAHQCQAYGTRWGRRISGTANNNCAGDNNPCGLQNYVSFASQGTNNRPWSSAFGPNPSFNVAVTEQAREVNLGAYAGAWGFLCPIFKDATSQHPTHRYVEYCFEMWKAGVGYPRYTQTPTAGWKTYDRDPACNSPTNERSVDQIVTRFRSDTAWFATQRPGSDSSFQWKADTAASSEASRAPRRFWATISKADLAAALRRINDPVSNGGCNRYTSPYPEDYALVGVENGFEAGVSVREIGANGSRLELYTTTDILVHGEWMSRGQKLTSANGRYAAVMQHDGNFVIYDNGTAVWWSGTYGVDHAALTLQTDGNLVIYRPEGGHVYASNTFASNQKSTLVMQDDGVLVLYTAGVAKWWRSRASPPG